MKNRYQHRLSTAALGILFLAASALPLVARADQANSQEKQEIKALNQKIRQDHEKIREDKEQLRKDREERRELKEARRKKHRERREPSPQASPQS